MTALTGTGRLADDIYLLAHHEVSGRPFLQPRAAGLGLAGGLLAELVLIRAIRVCRAAASPRTRSDGSGSIPGEVVRERALGRLKAAGMGGVLPGACGQVRNSPGEAVGVEGRHQPRAMNGAESATSSWAGAAFQNKCRRGGGNTRRRRHCWTGWQAHPRDLRSEREPPRRPEDDLVHHRLHGVTLGEHHRRLRDEPLGREPSEGTGGSGWRDHCPPRGLAHGRHAPR